jgi:hypothetical protein
MITVHRGMVQITPVFAAELLALPEAKHDNAFLPELVEQLAAKMREGRWAMPERGHPHLQSPGAPVVLVEIFSESAQRWHHQVWNGRHRLHACVLAGAPFVTNFVWHQQWLPSPLLGMYRR